MNKEFMIALTLALVCQWIAIIAQGIVINKIYERFDTHENLIQKKIRADLMDCIYLSELKTKVNNDIFRYAMKTIAKRLKEHAKRLEEHKEYIEYIERRLHDGTN